MLAPYPDRPLPLGRRVLGDLLAVAWTAAALAAGAYAYRLVHSLESAARLLAASGRTFDRLLAGLGGAVPPDLPILGSGLHDRLAELAASLRAAGGQPLIQEAGRLELTVTALAVLIGVLTAALPILTVSLTYATWRWRESRERGALVAFLEAARRRGTVAEAEALLAWRAATGLRLTRVMRVTADPVRDLGAGRHRALATALLESAGLDPARLYGRPRALVTGHKPA